MRLLPKSKREPMFEIYGFCRTVDDIADGDLPPDEKMRLLANWKQRIDDVLDGTDAVGSADGFSKTMQAYCLSRDDLFAVIDGMQTDAAPEVRMVDEAALDLYMDRVASAVGRLSNKVFGLEGPAADKLAHHLGRALQLTNILRDLEEDAQMNRLYVPQTLLAAHGISAQTPKDVLNDAKLSGVLVIMAAEAQGHFAAAKDALGELPRKQARPVRIMKAVYSTILQRMQARGWEDLSKTVQMNKLEKVLIAFRAGWW